MRNIFVISDTHFNHHNILNFVPIRPFSSTEEMNECMVDRWNGVVRDQDIIYHLGDVFFSPNTPPVEHVLARLKGRKRLILGNHDDGKSKLLQKYFQKILMWRKFPADFPVLLTHVPVHPSTLGEGRFKGKDIINVHGHVHYNSIHDPRYRNVCVEVTDYAPISLEDI